MGQEPDANTHLNRLQEKSRHVKNGGCVLFFGSSHFWNSGLSGTGIGGHHINATYDFFFPAAWDKAGSVEP